jgi:malonate-semialdehyde dehydrogenase (acetylating) / methylmalonate-semialdehyde dehydrogenase
MCLSGPLITPQAKERVEGLIGSCEKDGGRILLDGRGLKVEGFEKGNFVGPSVLDATTDMKCYK